MHMCMFHLDMNKACRDASQVAQEARIGVDQGRDHQLGPTEVFDWDLGGIVQHITPRGEMHASAPSATLL